MRLTQHSAFIHVWVLHTNTHTQLEEKKTSKSAERHMVVFYAVSFIVTKHHPS